MVVKKDQRAIIIGDSTDHRVPRGTTIVIESNDIISNFLYCSTLAQSKRSSYPFLTHTFFCSVKDVIFQDSLDPLVKALYNIP